MYLESVSHIARDIIKLMKSNDVRKKYIGYFAKRGHTEVPSAPILPLNDPTTLFTSSGMQPLVPYLLGQKHPSGNRLVDSQKSFRSQDIEEVGDNRHMTFFEMLGNWSLGDYFKKEQLPWIWEFLTIVLGLEKTRLFVSVFEGDKDVPRDEESASIWKSLGVPNEHIFYYGVKKNWWSRSGEPENMPNGEPGGPDSEVFFDFQTPHNPAFGSMCHPNCDCGRFMEIANSVFMQYQKMEDGTLKKYGEAPEVTQAMRVIADHLKAATFMICEGLFPGNKQQGYILRRLIRRSVVKMHQLGGIGFKSALGSLVFATVGKIYDGVYFEASSPDFSKNAEILSEEITRFENVLKKGMAELQKQEKITGTVAFNLLQSFGFPWELTYELATEKGQVVDRNEFQKEFKKHQELSRTAAAGMFKGGLADHSEATTSLHTAHHLLLAALQKCVDPPIKQRGSNITAERLRIDVSHARKFTPEELKKVEDHIQQSKH